MRVHEALHAANASLESALLHDQGPSAVLQQVSTGLCAARRCRWCCYGGRFGAGVAAGDAASADHELRMAAVLVVEPADDADPTCRATDTVPTV